MKTSTERIAVEGKHIRKDFQLGDSTTRVLKDISLQVARGEFVSIMGPSGSGKSTLLYIFRRPGRPHGRLRPSGRDGHLPFYR